MLYLLAAVTGLLFGGGVEHLGSLAFGPWGWTASQLSAPWLLLPFVLGMAGKDAGRAAALGLIGTLCAVAGYVLMLSYGFGSLHALELPVIVHEAGTQLRWFVAGTVSGPVYGVLGQRWRRFRWWPSAVLAAGSLALEPVALVLVGRTFGPSGVYVAEAMAGVVLGACFVRFARRGERSAGQEAR